MDAKTLVRWQRLAEASAPNLDATETMRRIEIHDEDSVWAMTDAATKLDHDNANFWAAARGIVLALVDEVRRLEHENDRLREMTAEEAEAARLDAIIDERCARAEDMAAALRKGEE